MILVKQYTPLLDQIKMFLETGKKALDSSSFKESFLWFLSTEWQRQEYGAILGQRQIYLALDHKCFRYTVRSGVIVREQVLALNSEHEEADTLIIYHLHKLMQDQ